MISPVYNYKVPNLTCSQPRKTLCWRIKKVLTKAGSASQNRSGYRKLTCAHSINLLFASLNQQNHVSGKHIQFAETNKYHFTPQPWSIKSCSITCQYGFSRASLGTWWQVGLALALLGIRVAEARKGVPSFPTTLFCSTAHMTNCKINGRVHFCFWRKYLQKHCFWREYLQKHCFGRRQRCSKQCVSNIECPGESAHVLRNHPSHSQKFSLYLLEMGRITQH